MSGEVSYAADGPVVQIQTSAFSPQLLGCVRGLDEFRCAEGRDPVIACQVLTPSSYTRVNTTGCDKPAAKQLMDVEAGK